jgi:hypothetical protein
MKTKLLLPIIILLLVFSIGTASAADLSESYYFTAYDAGVAWKTSPENMVDGVETSYSSTKTEADAQLLNVNNCSGTDLGVINSVEIRAYGYYSTDDQVTLTTIFTAGTGDDHASAVPATTGAWGSWFDITYDTNAPGTWTWTDVVNLDTTVNYITSGVKQNTYVGEVEIRVNYTENNAPIISNITMSHAIIKGGSTITIYANSTDHGVNDTDGVNTIQLFCDETEAQTSATNCTGVTLIDTTDPYDFICSFTTTADDTNHITFCRLYDGIAYSTIVNESYVTDSTPPSTSINSVAEDTVASYFDTNNNAVTDINITGESGMSCGWSSSDTTFGAMTSCTIQGDTANCSVNNVFAQGYHTRYISCQDSLSNENSPGANLNVSFYLDYTAPTTSDNGVNTTQVPPYTVTITEVDNLGGDPTTLYCTDTTGVCNPDTAIDNGQTITFTTANRGVNYLRYNSTDDAGNQQTTVNKTININQLPTFTSATDDATTIAGGITVNVSTVSTDVDGQEMTLWVCASAGATSAGCTGTEYCNDTNTTNVECTFTAELDSATHNWYAYIYDASDEAASNNPQTGSYTTDVTSPTITIDSPINGVTYTQNSLTFTITVNEALTNAWYTINDTINISMSNTSLLVYTHSNTSINDSNYNVTFWANDSYGNINQSSTIDFIINTIGVDNTDPTITIWSPINNTYYQSATTLLNITVDEDLNWAGYTNNSGQLNDLVQHSATNWNTTIDFAEGELNLTFYANDTSDNQASEDIKVYVDLINPYIIGFVCDDNINDSLNITCTANFTDTVSLNYAIIGYNATGIYQNSSQISLFGTSGNASFVIDNADTDPGNFTAEVYVYDSSGRSNTTTIGVNISDDTFPTTGNISYIPNTTDELDPDQQINVSADITEDYSISTVVLMYQNTTDTDWTVVSMTNTSATNYNASFTPANGTWTFAINATDTHGNQNISDNITIVVANETSVNVSTTITAIKSYIVSELAENSSLGDVILNNTGDSAINFTVNLSAGEFVIDDLSINYTLNQSAVYAVSANSMTNLSIEANTSALNSSGLYPYNVSVTYNPTIIYERNLNIQNANGPYLSTSITTYSSEVNTDGSIALVAQVNNLGTGDALNVNLSWELPSGWTINSGSETREFSSIPIGSSATNTINVTVGSTATTEIVTATAVSTNADSSSDSKTITIGTPEVVTVTTGDSGGGSSGGGGGGSGGGAREYSETEVVVEVVRGTVKEIPITITNPYEGATLEDVKISIEGFISQYVTVYPDFLSTMQPGETRSFTLVIDAPSYLDQDEYILKSSITGNIVYGNLTRSLVDKRIFTLLIQEIDSEEISTLLEQAQQDIADMKEADFKTTKVEKLLSEATSALEERDNTLAYDLATQIHDARLLAFHTYDLLSEVQRGIDRAEDMRLNVPESKNMYNLAKAAFDREDYETANQRAEDAQMTLFIETKGRLNLFWFILTYWWAIIIGLFAMSIVLYLSYKKIMATIITRKLKNLNKEEQTIHNMMKKLQRDTFDKKKISSMEYKNRSAKYSARISKIAVLRAKLRNRRVALLKKEEIIKDIERETSEVTNIIKKTQRKYFEHGKISRQKYLDEFKMGKERLAEVEEERATVEAEIEKEKQDRDRKPIFSKFERDVLRKHNSKKALAKKRKKFSFKKLSKSKNKPRIKRRLFRRGVKINMSHKKKRK